MNFFNIFAAACLLLSAVDAEAAFYRYRNAENRFVFVDDIANVPAEFLDSVKVYSEAGDYMTDSQRRAHETEQARRQAHQRQRYLQHIRQIEAKSARARTDAPPPVFATPVKIAYNQVLVPVKMGYGGVETDATLLLDTGANVTVIHQEVADALGLRWPKRATVQVAGGRRLRAGFARLDHLSLGELRLDDIDVGIIVHEGGESPYAGLLGMNVLGRLDFKVDLEAQTITWKPRPEEAPPP